MNHRKNRQYYGMIWKKSGGRMKCDHFCGGWISIAFTHQMKKGNLFLYRSFIYKSIEDKLIKTDRKKNTPFIISVKFVQWIEINSQDRFHKKLPFLSSGAVADFLDSSQDTPT